MPLYDFPDIVPELLDALDVLVSDCDVAGDLKGWHAPEKRVTIQSTGGAPRPNGRGTDERFDVNVYAPAKPAAKALALQVAAKLYTLNNHAGTGFIITDVDVTMPADITDPINSNPRFVFDATISYRRRP